MNARLTCVIAGLLSFTTLAVASDDPILAAVMARDAELQAANGRGDREAYRAGLSKDYVYIDIAGQRVTVDMLDARRAEDHRRVVSSESSEEETIRVSDSVVLLRGLERSVATYYGGLPRVSSSRWSALWVREDDGVWRLLADTSTPVRGEDSLPFVHVPQPEATLAALAGHWRLATDPPMALHLSAEDGELIGSLEGYQARFPFQPASATHYFATNRPFELRFSDDGQHVDLVTWGTATAATRVTENRGQSTFSPARIMP